MILTRNKLNKIIKNNLKETRFIFGDYEEEDVDSNDKNLKKSTGLSAKNMSKNIGSKLNFMKFNSNEESKEFIKNIAGPDTFISFIDPYEKEDADSDDSESAMKVPSFSLNPNATFNTPHGIYAYPFDTKHCEKFIITGQPTNAEFAIARPYFHLIRIDLNHPNVISFNADGSSNKSINRNKYLKELNELIRVHCKYYNKDENEKENISESINERLKESIHFQLRDLGMSNDEKFDKLKEKFLNNHYYKLYKAAFYLCFENVLRKSYGSEEKNSELYALLLNVIGMKCIVDNNTGTIHENEPTQMHILTFGENDSFYEYVGTFKNNIKANEKELSDYISNLKYTDIVKFYSKLDGSKCFDKNLIDTIFNLYKNDDDIMSLFVKLIYEKLMTFCFDTEERIDIINKIISQDFVNWLETSVVSASGMKNIKKWLGINEENISNKYTSLKDWISLFKEKSKSQITFLLHEHVLNKFDGLEILIAARNIDLKTFCLLYEIIMYEHEFNKKITEQDNATKTFLLNTLSNIDIDIFKNIIKATDIDLFKEQNTIEMFINKNINDLKRIDIFFNYISNSLPHMEDKIKQYIKNKVKNKNESLKKLKALIRYELKNILH